MLTSASEGLPACWLWLWVFTVVLYAGPTGSAHSISCSLLCFELYWTRKDGLLVDIWELFCLWCAPSTHPPTLPVQLHYSYWYTSIHELREIRESSSSVISHHCFVFLNLCPPNTHCWLLSIYSVWLIAEYMHYNCLHMISADCMVPSLAWHLNNLTDAYMNCCTSHKTSLTVIFCLFPGSHLSQLPTA